MSRASSPAYVARYVSDRWRTVQIANVIMAVVGLLLVVLGGVWLRESTARGIAVGITGLAFATIGMGNLVAGKRRFVPADMVALGVEPQSLRLPNCEPLPWSAVTSVEFSYRPEGGTRKPLDVLFFNDDRKIVVHLNRSNVPVEYHAALLRQDSDVFYHGLETAYVSALDGGESAYLELIQAVRRCAPPQVELKITFQDKQFRQKVGLP